jgi:hypothetical protein
MHASFSAKCLKKERMPTVTLTSRERIRPATRAEFRAGRMIHKSYKIEQLTTCTSLVVPSDVLGAIQVFLAVALPKGINQSTTNPMALEDDVRAWL